MRVLIVGAAGMIGRKLAERIAGGATLGEPVSSVVLADVVAPTAPAGLVGAEVVAADLSAPGEAARLVAGRPALIFHLAAIVSGEAEADFERGYRVNLDGTRMLLEAIRQEPDYRPRLVFASSVAAFGAPFPDVIPDDFVLAPLTSYGTQKAIGELLLNDYSRRGFVDGVGIRLPTICIRPGAPNKAASGFFSSILREPLVGREAVLPVDPGLRHWFASPRTAIDFLLRAATMDTGPLGWRRTLSMPGLSATVGEAIAALREVAGERAAGLIRREPDPAVQAIVGGWAQAFDPARATALGFAAERSFEEIIRVHIEDELGGSLPAGV